jgi:hypothetical protein
MKNIFVITLATLGLLWACQKENNVVSPNNIIGKWEYVKVEFYELSETGEKANFIENAEQKSAYIEINVPHTLEINDTHVLLWTGYRFPSEESKYVLEDDTIYLEYTIGRTDEYIIKTLNKKEMVVLGREEEFRFDPSQDDYIEAYPFIYYRRIK